MVVKRQCSFCASEIEPGTGWTFVKRDGTVFHFCSSSCRKQQLHLGRVGHRFKWTRAHALRVAAEHSATEKPTAARIAPTAKDARRPGSRPPGAAAPATEIPPAENAPGPAPVAAEAARPSGEAGPDVAEPAAEGPAKARPRARKKPSAAPSAKK